MLKTSHSVNYFKQTVNRSELIIEQKKDTLLSSSQQTLKLPEDFTIGKAIGGGDCFFDAVAQGLKQLKPDMEFTIKSLRQICKNLALSNQQLKDEVIRDAKNSHDPKVVLPDPSISDDELWDAYLASIEYTAEDMKGMEIQDPQLYKSLSSLKYGSMLQVPIWGRPNIEGKMICSKYNVKLHIIENLPNSGYSHQLINELTSRSIDCVDYDEENTIHIINKGTSHFEPILRKQILPHCYDTTVSKKKSDSKFMYFQQVSKKEMIDNQMDCEDYKESSPGVEVLPDESIIEATVDYEDRLSDEELQHERSQDSPRVTRSSSISSSSTWYSALTDCRSTVGDIGLTDNEIVERAALFIKTFVGEFEEKLSQYSKEAKPGSKVRKAGKITGALDPVMKSAVRPGTDLPDYESIGGQLFPVLLKKGIDSYLEERHRKGAKKVSAAVIPFKNEIRKILVEAGLEICQSFERQFTKVVDTNQLSWERGIDKLAIDAVSRVMNYVLGNKGGFSVDLITKGVVLGKSKTDTFAKQVLHKPAKLFKSGAFQPGYEVKDKQSDKALITSELYGKVGIKKIEGDTIKYYQLKERGCAEKYGYRLPFEWELEKWENIEQKYVLSRTSKEGYVNILDEEKKKELASSILKEINGNDSTKKKDIEELHEEIKNLRIRHEKEGKNTFSFNLSHLPEFFIKREVILNELKKELSSKDQEVKMSRMVLINGKYGTGKSELAKSYAYSREGDSISSTWKNVVWINAETCDTLLNSFRNLAEELKIPKKKYIDHNIAQDMEVESIIKNVYERFQNVKSLFIFDNASEYKEIEKFLPSHFSYLFFGKEKPYVLITSRNKNWKKEIEKIDLDNGFSLGEAITFIERTLEIKNTLQDQYLVELVKALKHLPLALKQATAYIKQEGISISEYLKRYNEAVQEPSSDRLEALGVTKELFTTLTLNLDKIRREKNIGQPACNILYCMAYLDSNQIDIAEIFLQKKSEKDKQQTLDALDRLHKFSVIELEESIARIHMGVQKTIRVKREQEETEEETLRKIMTSFCPTDKNHITSVWSYVSKYDRLVNEFIDSLYDGSTILHLLAKDGNEEVIKLILEKVDPNKLSKIINAVDGENCTSLDYAAMYGHLGIVRYLIEKGTDFNGDDRNFTPLHWAAVCGQLEIVKYFIDNEYLNFDNLSEEGNTPLYYAIKHGYLDIVKYLVEKGDSVNLQDEDDVSPLYYAIKYGYLDIVKYLVEKGADINLRDEDGMSPLHYAIYEEDRLGIIEYLVEKGANINLQYKDGMSPFHYAVKNGCLDIVKYLVEKGASINLKDEDGLSSFHYAVKNGYLDIVKYLVEKGADINIQDEGGMSPLFYALTIVIGRPDIACHLIEYCSLVQEEVSVKLKLKNFLHERKQRRSAHLNEPKKRKLENISATFEENASNIQLLQGSQNPPSDMSMQFEGLADRTESIVNINSEMPAYSFNSVAVESVNNKNLKGS